jgi:hypothetical protein
MKLLMGGEPDEVEARLRTIWEVVDGDQSGTLDEGEVRCHAPIASAFTRCCGELTWWGSRQVKHVFEQMGAKWASDNSLATEERFTHAFRQMDEDGSGEIDFGEMLVWWNVQKGKGDDWLAIETAIDRYDGFTKSVMSTHGELVTHRNKLLEMAKRHMVELLECPERLEIEAAMEKYEIYGNAARVQLRNLRMYHKKLVMIDELRKKIKSDDFGAVETCLSTYHDCTGRARGFWEKLEVHRNAMVKSAKQKLEDILGSPQLTTVQACITDHEPYGKWVREERERAIVRCAFLQSMQDLYDLGSSDDFAAILAALEEWEDSTDKHIRDLLTRIQTRHDQLVQAVSMALQELVAYVAPVAMGAALDRYAAYEAEVTCREAMEAVRLRRNELIKEAKLDLKRMLAKESATIEEMDEMVGKYRTYPPVRLPLLGSDFINLATYSLHACWMCCPHAYLLRVAARTVRRLIVCASVAAGRYAEADEPAGQEDTGPEAGQQDRTSDAQVEGGSLETEADAVRARKDGAKVIAREQVGRSEDEGQNHRHANEGESRRNVQGANAGREGQGANRKYAGTRKEVSQGGAGGR